MRYHIMRLLFCFTLFLVIFMVTLKQACGHQSSFSLMFSPNELPSLSPLPLKDRRQRLEEGIFLSGIVYTNSKEWVVWLNGQRIDPHIRVKDLQIIEVTPNSVQFKWIFQGEVHSVTLLTAQTYLARTKRIQWGDPGVKSLNCL